MTSSAVGLIICAIIPGIKKYKSMLKKKKKYDKVVLLGKDKLNNMQVLISKALVDSYISNDEFVSINNVLREYNEMKKIKNKKKILKLLWNAPIETYCVSCKKYTANRNLSLKKTKQNRLLLLSNCTVCGKKNKFLLMI